MVFCKSAPLLRWLALLAVLSLACNLPVNFRALEGSPVPSSTQMPPSAPTSPGPPVTVLPHGSLATAAVPPAARTPTAPAFRYTPVFEPGPCRFGVPAGYDPQCGDLLVPENRARTATRMIRLHAAIFRSRSPNPAPDPVIHLAGGPGSSSLDSAGYMLRQGLNAVLDRSDLILFDQRGTGASQPLLDCPERETANPALLQRGLTAPGSSEIIVQAFRACRERLLAEGVDLSAYTSAASAADVDDLRQALGYAQVNLYGVSYGTRMALTILRDFPGSVRSAVLDSTYPPQAHLYTALPASAARAFDVFFARQNDRHPGLREAFYALVDQLNTRPAEVPYGPGGANYTARLDGGLLMDVLLVGLYNPSVAETMPEMIAGVRQGDYTLLWNRLNLYLDSSGAPGMTMAVQCAEEILFASPQDAYAQPETVPPSVTEFFAASVQPLWEVCREWHPDSPDPRENQPVASDVPVLILAGAGDPITPPDWGRQAVQTLPRSRFVELPGQGHWTTRSSACALSLALSFWQDPAADLDTTCVQPE